MYVVLQSFTCRGLGTGASFLRGTPVFLSTVRHMRGYDGFDPKTTLDGLDYALTNITYHKGSIHLE